MEFTTSCGAQQRKGQDMADKVLSMIGLAHRAGKVQIGAFLTERAIADGSCELIVLAEDTAQNNHKKFSNSAKYEHIPMLVYGTKETLAHALGRENTVVAGVTDKNFAKGIMEKYQALQRIKAQMGQ